MIVYVTKYALTKGIFIDNVHYGYLGKVCSSRSFEYYEKGQYYENIKEAIDKANEMKDKKLDSLEKEIEVLHKLEFNENTVK